MEDHKIFLKVDDSYLDGISRFRIAIDQMNSSFMDLIFYFRDDFFDSCKNIVSINQKFIRDLIATKTLTHEQQFSMIDNYFQIKDSNGKNAQQLLEDIKDKIKNSFDEFYNNSNESPIDNSMSDQFHQDQSESLKKFESLKKILNESRESIDSDDMMIYDDFMESKIIPLFKDDDYDPYDNNDDDDDDINNKRYYGNPYINVPKKVQKAINKYLSFANSLISINSILNFDATKDKYKQKAQTQEQKIKKEQEEEEQRREIERREAEIREKEKAEEKERQKLAKKEIPELRKIKQDLEEDVQNLEDNVQNLEKRKGELDDQVNDLENKNDELNNEVEKLEKYKEKLNDEIQKLEEAKANLEEEIRKLQEQNPEGKSHFDDYSKKIIITLLEQLSRIKTSFNELKNLQNKPK